MALSSFIGREDERRRLASLLREHRLVTVTGPGGMGKSRLAGEVLEDVGGPVRWAELAELDGASGLPSALAGQLGFTSLDDLVAAAEGDHPPLAVLDGCEHLLDELGPVVASLLERAPALRVLATSRERLGLDGEHLLVLGPLGLPPLDDPAATPGAPAAALLLDRAGAAGASWDRSPVHLGAVAQLCHRLDGSPLALELAASRARSMTPTDVLDNLDRRLDLLRRSDGGTGRHRSLRAVIDASYDALAPPEQRFFRRLAVFRGPFTTELAHEVCGADGTDRFDTIDVLGRLVDRSVVTGSATEGRARFVLLDSLRSYADERLDDAGEREATFERFVERMVVEADRLVAAALARWTPEVVTSVRSLYRSIVAAIDWCVDHDDGPERAFRLVLPLWGALTHALAGEAAAVGLRVLERWPDGDEPVRPEATAVVANAALTAGRLETAVALARRCLEVPEVSPIAALVAERVLAFAARNAGDVGAAHQLFGRATARAEVLGATAFTRELRLYEAWAAHPEDDLASRLAVVDEVRAAAAASGEDINVVRADVIRAFLLVLAGRADEAGPDVASASSASEALAYPWGRGASLRLGAVLAARAGDHGEAESGWRRSTEVFLPHGDLDEVTLVLRAAARLARADDAGLARSLLAAAPRRPQPAGATGWVDDLADVAAAPAGRRLALPEALRLACDVLAGGSTGADRGAPPPTAVVTAAGRLQRLGDGWQAAWAGQDVLLRHGKGIQDLCTLLGRPHHEVHCLELMGARAVSGDVGPALDDTARRRYGERIRVLQEEVDEARDANDSGRAERAELELDLLVQQLSDAFGLGGRARVQGSTAERARSAVTARLRATIKRIGEVHPRLGRHLEVSVRTGTWCSYRPELDVTWEVDPG